MVGRRNGAVDATRCAYPVVGMEEVVYANREGATGVGETRSVACFSVGRRESAGEPLICVGDRSVVEVAASDDRVVGVAVDDSTDAVGLNTSIGSSFAELAHEHFRTALDGLAVRLNDGIGIFVLFFWAEVSAFQVVVDDKQAVAVAVDPTSQTVIGASGIFDMNGVAQER